MKKQVPHDFDINKYEMIAQVIENRMTDTKPDKLSFNFDHLPNYI